MLPEANVKHQSFEARASRRNRAADQRNQKKRDGNPLFDQAGILDQVVRLEAPNWTALSVAYDILARDIASYERAVAEERRNRQKYAVYRQMLCEAIGEENVEEVEADYTERWRGHRAMEQWGYRLNYLNNYLARYAGRAPLDVYEEAQRRLERPAA